MAKSCIPGVLCVQNMTLFVLVAILALVVYMLASGGSRSGGGGWNGGASSPNVVVVAAAAAGGGGSAGVVGDMYSPPLSFEEALRRVQSVGE